MITNIFEDRIIQYFEGALSAEESNDLMKELEHSSELRDIFDEYTLLYSDLNSADPYLPSEGLKENFEHMLDEEREKIQSNNISNKAPRVFTLRQIFSYAAIGLVLCCMCYLVKINLDKDKAVTEISSELIALRGDMHDLMKDESTTSRIRAVNMSYDVSNADPDVIDVLSETLLNDESANVRLAAASALSQFTAEASVKTSLIDALKKENDASVQIELINILSTIKEQNALPGFEKLLEKEDLQKFVKDEIHLGKIKIESI